MNTDIHNNLLALGYEHRHFEEDFYDDGDAESGPHLAGHPAFDEYRSRDDYIIISEEGLFVWWEPRDLEREAYEESMCNDS